MRKATSNSFRKTTNVFPNVNSYNHARHFYNGMTNKAKLMGRYVKGCSSECNFAHPRYNCDRVIAASKEIFATIY